MASNPRARELTVGVLSPYLGGYYFGEVMTELHRNARTMNVRLLSIRTGRREPLAMPLACDLVDGWIVVLDCITEEQLDALCASGKPVVSVAHDFGRPDVVSVESGNRRAINAAVDYMVAAGHRAIAFAGMFAEHDHQQRRIGFRTALARHGMPVRAELEVNVDDSDYAAGRRAARELLARDKGVTAVLACTDLLAAGIIDALKEAGRRVPEDIAVIGYDNNSLARAFDPPIATIDQNLTILTRVALDAVCSRGDTRGDMRGDTRVDTDARAGGTLLVENSFLPRASCGGPASSPADPCQTSAPFSFDAHMNELNIGFELTKDLVGASFDKVLDRMWNLAPFLEWACIGAGADSDDPGGQLLIQDVVDLQTLDSHQLLDQRIPLAQFPPLDHLPPVRFRERFITLVPILFNGVAMVLAVTGRLRNDADIARYATLMRYVDLLSLAFERALVDDESRRREHGMRRLAEQLDHTNHTLEIRVQAHTRSLEEKNRELMAMNARLSQMRQELETAQKAGAKLTAIRRVLASNANAEAPGDAATKLASLKARIAAVLDGQGA